MKSPDFFVVGAPKCGTTALVDYLKGHPEVFIPAKKELNHFGADLRIADRPRPTRAQYLQFFAGASDEKRAGEGSVWSLFSRRAAAEIKEFCPTAGIIVMLRDPVETMYALHAQHLSTGVESIRDFAAALAAEPDRVQGRQLAGRERLVDCLRYRDAVRYTAQVRRYLDVFGRDQVHVIIFDDFARATADVYRGVCEFLNVNPEFQPDFRVVNRSKQVRSRLLVDALRWSAPAVRPGPPRGPARAWRALRWRLKRWNTAEAPRPPMDSGLRQQLIAEYRPEVEALGDLLGRDLSGWCR
jgi:hypothetical protein